MKLVKACLIVLALPFFFTNSKAQTYNTRAETISSGGGVSTGSNYSNFGVLSETFVANLVTGGVYKTTIGFINSVSNEVETSTNTISNFKNQAITIYPNPTNGTLMFESSIKLENIEIFDMLGNLVYISRFKSEIDISNLSIGIYLLKLYYKENESVIVQKIMLNR